MPHPRIAGGDAVAIWLFWLESKSLVRRETLEAMRAGLIAWYRENGETLEPRYRIGGS